MKILIYSHEFLPWKGGIATYNYELARALAEIGQDVILLAPKYSPEDSILDQGMPFLVIRSRLPLTSIMHFNKNILNLPASMIKFIKAVSQFKPDQTLITQYMAQQVAALSRIIYPFRYSLVVHGTEVFTHFSKNNRKQMLKAKLMHWFFDKADNIICVSHSTKHLLEDKAAPLRPKINVVPLGINPDDFSITEKPDLIKERLGLSGQKIILTVSRLEAGKGQDAVLKALPKVLEIFPETKYLIIGDGEERPKLEKLATNLKIEKAVMFLGSIDRKKLSDFFKACNLFIMVSRRGQSESFGFVYLEAWAHEKPVIGGHQGGVAELIISGQNGLLVDPNDVDQIAEAIIKILSDENLSRQMGQRGKEMILNQFTSKVMAMKTLKILQGEK